MFQRVFVFTEYRLTLTFRVKIKSALALSLVVVVGSMYVELFLSIISNVHTDASYVGSTTVHLCANLQTGQ